ncbi:hypothetical protein BJ138DRAFT_1102735 [Hygrophoropsis aurantiaca]|uniref:Uncharacterized protein n=1 Tax=Hygrophoropsis aurantiaca TaxID=72124 RepID=A0ACB8A9N1_9AGAM|nr:hypothetical protein BJ138DRAFT_1102735 [Hygrophoropsis aurantiaca]
MESTVICVGCAKKFPTNRSLTSHTQRCQKAKDLAASTTLYLEKKRKSDKRKKREETKLAKKAKLEEQLAQDEHQEDVIMQEPEPYAPPPESPVAGPSHHGPSLAPAAPPVVSNRSGRTIRLPARFVDFLPGSSTHLPHMPLTDRQARNQKPPPEPVPENSPPPMESSPEPECEPSRSHPVTTPPNDMGLFRVYPTLPTLIPVDGISLDSVCDAPALREPDMQQGPDISGIPEEPGPDNVFSAFSSPSAAMLMAWQYSGSTTKSGPELIRLVQHLRDPAVNLDDIRAYDHTRETKNLDKVLDNVTNPFNVENGWRNSSVRIKLPKENAKSTTFTTEEYAPDFEVKGVYHRDLTDIITQVFQDKSSNSFNMTPFEQYWQPSNDEPPVRVYSEAYSSPEMLDAHAEINALPRDPDDNLERVVASLMMWSDATHLANFGTASLWPFYLYFGNQSKYTRAKPTAQACHHVAYIPSLPDELQDHYVYLFGDAWTNSVHTHCKRELFHEIWKLLLDEKFMEAYRHADYPEKILIATIKFLGKCPCPRCLVRKIDIPRMGMALDMRTRRLPRMDSIDRRQRIELARKLVFKGVPIDSEPVSTQLRTPTTSLVPTRNAFSDRLFELKFNLFMMLVVDLLHEFELGVWKAIFTHLMRILVAQGGTAIADLNKRYRNVPTYGRGTIRRFHKNAAAMNKLAARDFEDLLQCAIPVFEGLLPHPHNNMVLDLLFDLAVWHAYAKLRLHTDTTLDFFEVSTTVLGQTTKQFMKTTCAAYKTRELPKESAARGRRSAALNSTKATGVPSMSAKQAGKQKEAPLTSDPKRKLLNLNTYKYHALGDYPDTIRRFGTTDSYSTQTGELQHRRLKRRYPRTAKNTSSTASFTRQEARERLIEKMIMRRSEIMEQEARNQNDHQQAPPQADPREERIPPSDHYYISKVHSSQFDITAFLSDHLDNPITEDFLPRLKDHLLARLLGIQYEGDEHDFTNNQRNTVIIRGNKLYEHKVLRVNYTTYDIRREQDSINPRTHADIMVLAHEDANDNDSHPYWYARILKILHVNVRHTGNESTSDHQMDVLFVRWFGRDTRIQSGFTAKRLPRVGYLPIDEPGAFGFLDPDQVIRGVHLIPAFAYDRTANYIPSSIAQREEGEVDDWLYHYVNIFVDRDMFMRYRGGGIGHKATRHWDRSLQKDQHLPTKDDPHPDEEADGEWDGEDSTGGDNEGDEDHDSGDDDNGDDADDGGGGGDENGGGDEEEDDDLYGAY